MSAIKEQDLRERMERQFREVLESIPVVEVIRVDEDASIGRSQRADLVVSLKAAAGTRRLIVEVKTEGLPRTLRGAAQALRESLSDRADTYGVVAAPYISERGRAICREMGIGCFDLAGNVSLAFDQLFIERSGMPNPAPVRRLQKSLFAPKSTRILRILLKDPGRFWYVRDLAREAGISLAQTSKVKRLLSDQDFLKSERRAFRLTRAGDLLQEWAKAYTYEVNDSSAFYTMLSVSEAEERLAVQCEREGVRYGLALFSGANRVAPYARYNQMFAFVDKAPKEIAEPLGLRSVPSGANVILLRPYDEGVFYGLQDVAGAKVVSDLQLYLDLKGYKGRGEEAADFLYERRIKTRWDQESDPNTPEER